MFEIRRGGDDDKEWLLSLFDEAVRWMVARGQSGQWGTEPFSRSPRRIASTGGMIDSGGLRVAEWDGEPVAALVVGIAPLHVPPPELPGAVHQPADQLAPPRGQRDRIGTGAPRGRRGSRRNVQQVRVDCWAGAPALVRWYCDQGFEPTGTFDVDGWPGQIFAMPLPAPAAPVAARFRSRVAAG